MAQPELRRHQAASADPAAALRLGEDDFSIRVASSQDPIFWVRVEREPADAVVVTDFNPGSRPLEELEAGLLMAVRALAPARLETLVFRDLLPGGDQQPGVPLKLVRTADLAKTLANTVAARFGRAVSGFRIENRNGKLDAVLRLAGR